MSTPLPQRGDPQLTPPGAPGPARLLPEVAGTEPTSERPLGHVFLYNVPINRRFPSKPPTPKKPSQPGLFLPASRTPIRTKRSPVRKLRLASGTEGSSGPCRQRSDGACRWHPGRTREGDSPVGRDAGQGEGSPGRGRRGWGGRTLGSDTPLKTLKCGNLNAGSAARLPQTLPALTSLSTWAAAALKVAARVARLTRSGCCERRGPGGPVPGPATGRLPGGRGGVWPVE